MWDLETGQDLMTFSGHSDYVRRCALSPDGARVVSASLDRTLKVWDLKSGEEVITLSGHSNRSMVALSVQTEERWPLHHGTIRLRCGTWKARKAQ